MKHFPFPEIVCAPVEAEDVNIVMADESTDLYKLLRSIVGSAVKSLIAAPFYSESGDVLGIVQAPPPHQGDHQ